MGDYLEEEEPDERSPVKQAIIVGILLIIIATVGKLVTDWVAFPATIDSPTLFFHAALESLIFVLNFDFKLWWVFLLVIYIIARWYKR